MRRFFVLILILLFRSALADEGMYPISELYRIDFKAKGFNVTAKEIFNQDSTSLTDAIVNLSGCTGSFISANGLILTNHHCAFSAVQRASNQEHDFLHDGFAALKIEDEFPAKGFSARITESYHDVSEKIVQAMSAETDYAKRTKVKERVIKTIVAECEKLNPGKRAEIAEMFSGKTYVLFIYTYLRDVRLVYAPPLGIGNFGGEEDNWVWPRHTGDFSLMRVYTALDGSAAEYSSQNVPYHPKKYLSIALSGADENELVFILGYPGRTYRHNTSHYLTYESTVRMPWIVNWYGFQIKAMEEMSLKNQDAALKLADNIKGLANTYKNYQGKLKGLKRLALIQRKQEEEKALQIYIDEDPQRKALYGKTLSEIGKIYDELTIREKRGILMDQLLKSSTLFNVAYQLYLSSIEMQKPDLDRDSDFMERNVTRTKTNIQLTVDDYYEPKDRLFFHEILRKWQDISVPEQPKALYRLIVNKNPNKAIEKFLDHAYRETRLHDAKWVMAYWGSRTEELLKSKDPFILLAKELYPDYQELREIRRKRSGELDMLYAQLIEVKQLFQGKDFMPDANSTLRFTYGHIRGFSPTDAVYYKPYTTVAGIVEKNIDAEPYQAPPRLLDLHKEKNYGRFEHPKAHDVPVDILYDTDTTGGNSGSPVLNSQGQLVGLNFDRAYAATINDYAWSSDYSRSIGVDIRYILWILEKYSKADYLIREMEIKQSDVR